LSDPVKVEANLWLGARLFQPTARWHSFNSNLKTGTKTGGRSQLSEGLQARQTLLRNILGRAIHGDPLKKRETLSSKATNRSQVVDGHRNGIACREKDGFDLSPIGFARFPNVLADFLYRPDFVGWTLLVDHAECTLVVRAPHRGLNQ